MCLLASSFARLPVTWLAKRCGHIPGASSSTPRQAGSEVTHLSAGLAPPRRGEWEWNVFSQPRPDSLLCPRFLSRGPFTDSWQRGHGSSSFSAELFPDSGGRGERVHTGRGMRLEGADDFKYAPRGTLCKAQMDLRASFFSPPSPSYHSTHSPLESE